MNKKEHREWVNNLPKFVGSPYDKNAVAAPPAQHKQQKQETKKHNGDGE